jgi:AcrR family transcriptional regulator
MTKTLATPPSRTSREDWLHRARDLLVARGVAEVKILTLSQELGVSRSSFYWYFKSRAELLDALLEEWEARTTGSILRQCARPAEDITMAVCHFFRCFLDPAMFDQGLDFAVRAWSRTDPSIRQRIDVADQTRLEAVTAMFARHGYPEAEADARARILYFMQLGYHALEVREPMELRSRRLGPYLKGFTGVEPDPEVVARFADLALRLNEGKETHASGGA